MLSIEDLRHNLPGSPAVFFVLKNGLTEQRFFKLLTALETVAVSVETAVTKNQYWEAIAERMQGKRRWDTLVPRFTGDIDGGGLIKLNESLNVAENIPKHRPYARYVVDEVKYVIDLFNPANELELPYRGAGEAVVALLLANALKTFVLHPLPVRDKLRDIANFYKIVDQFIEILEPENVCGGFYIARVTMAYQHAKEKLSEEVRPWDFLWTMNVLDVGRVNGIERNDLERTFAKVVDLSNGQILLQVMPGFDSIMGREYTFASRLLKMKPVTEIDLD